MKQFSQQLYKKAASVKLRATEKRDLEARLRVYMEYHPFPEHKRMSVAKRATNAGTLFAEPFASVAIPFRAIFKGAFTMAVLLLVVVPIMAERTVPGDVLYAVKVQVNEELRSTLLFDSQQKVEWETERLNRRIAEARLLASEGRLTEEVEVEVAKAVRTHTDNVKKEIQALREVDADGATIASIALDTTLEVQSTALRGGEQLVEGVASARIATVNLLADAIDASRSPSDVALSTSSLPSYEKLMARVEQNTTRVYELRSGLADTVTPSQLAEVDRRIEDVNRSISEAIAATEESQELAREQLVDVIQRTQKIIVYITELEVAEIADIESLVPMVLTDAEKTLSRNTASTTLAKKIGQIEASLIALENDAVYGKIENGLEQIALLQLDMASTTLLYEVQLQAAKSAHVLADDMLRLLEGQGALVREVSSQKPATSSSSVVGTEESATTSTSVSTTTAEVDDAELESEPATTTESVIDDETTDN